MHESVNFLSRVRSENARRPSPIKRPTSRSSSSPTPTAPSSPRWSPSRPWPAASTSETPTSACVPKPAQGPAPRQRSQGPRRAIPLRPVLGGAAVHSTARSSPVTRWRALFGAGRFADQSQVSEWWRAESGQSVAALPPLLREFVAWVRRKADPRRLLHAGQREVFFDDANWRCRASISSAQRSMTASSWP